MELGIHCNIITYDTNIAEDVIIEKIKELNKNLDVKGIMVQLPLPKILDKNKILNCIDPKKDVDGLHPYNLGENYK